MIEGHEIVSPCGAVAAGPEEAARVGARILAAGGNAMDAAAAASLVCCMLAPQSTGVGGYVLAAVVLEGGSGRVWSLDANAVAPAGARADIYQVQPRPAGVGGINEDEYDCQVQGNANVHGPLAVAVPGQMGGMGLLWERWGRLEWPQIVAPSLQLLAEGFPYGEGLAGSVRGEQEVIRRFEPTGQHLMPAGRLPEPGDIWHRPDMEKTLERLAAAGWRDFYEGELGRRIADYIQGAGGVLTRADMAGFAPRLSEPYAVSYRDARVYGPILPNGCFSSLQALQLLECFDPVPEDQVRYWHGLAEVLKLAWRDRLVYAADPDFVDVPIERLLSKEYAAGRAETLRQFPHYVDRLNWGGSPRAASETLHVSAADVEGNVVSATISQGGTFGSCVTVPGTGIILGHGMCRLDPRPGRANSVAPGKRPLNNTAPMILRLPDRDVGIGMPGGRRIISVAVRLAQQLVDFKASAYAAAAAPRMHVMSAEPVAVLKGINPDIVDGLGEMGHQVEVVERIGGAVHGAEYLKTAVRAGGNTWAAGVT